jgi:hypothetical protein
MKTNTKPERANIINLIGALRKFKPTLVNETTKTVSFEPKNPSDAPDRDTLLNLIGMAVMDIQSFIENFEHHAGMVAELRSDAMMAHQELQKAGIKADSLCNGFSMIVDRHRQALDIILNISQLPLGQPQGNLEKAVRMCIAYIDNMRRRLNATHVPLVNETTNGSQTKETTVLDPSTLSPLPQPPAAEDAGSGDQEGEPRS